MRVLEEGASSVEEVAGRFEGGVEVTGPRIEAWICESKMWVPGPGAYLDIGPRSWPGRAREGRDISGDCIGKTGSRWLRGLFSVSV